MRPHCRSYSNGRALTGTRFPPFAICRFLRELGVRGFSGVQIPRHPKPASKDSLRENPGNPARLTQQSWELQFPDLEFVIVMLDNPSP